MKKKAWLLLSLALVLVGASVIYAKLPSIRKWVYYAAVFNNPHCGVSDGLRAFKVWKQSNYTSAVLTHVTTEDHAAGLELRSTGIGDIWIPAHDAMALHYILAERKADVYGAGQAIQAGDIVLDCGAYVGTFTSQALEAGAKLVVAIEPVPNKIECLRRNLQSEIQAGRVIIYPKGVWDKDEILPLHRHAQHSGGDSFVLDRESTAEKLELTTIDRLVKELKLERVDFIKMDIEGAEIKALAGAASTIRAFHPALALAVYHVSTDREEIPRQIGQLWSGYQPLCGVCQLKEGRLRPDIMYFR